VDGRAERELRFSGGFRVESSWPTSSTTGVPQGCFGRPGSAMSSQLVIGPGAASAWASTLTFCCLQFKSPAIWQWMGGSMRRTLRPTGVGLGKRVLANAGDRQLARASFQGGLVGCTRGLRRLDRGALAAGSTHNLIRGRCGLPARHRPSLGWRRQQMGAWNWKRLLCRSIPPGGLLLLVGGSRARAEVMARKLAAGWCCW